MKDADIGRASLQNESKNRGKHRERKREKDADWQMEASLKCGGLEMQMQASGVGMQ
jgi:hypothetical protein